MYQAFVSVGVRQLLRCSPCSHGGDMWEEIINIQGKVSGHKLLILWKELKWGDGK